jgi:thiol:disulfide interchange protein
MSNIDYVIMETREDLKKYLKETTADTTIIKLTATWCRPCKMIEPTLAQLNEQYMAKKVNYEYIEIDVDNATDLYAFFKKMRMANGIPTILCFKKQMYTDTHYYVPYKCMTGADTKLVTQFFQLCLG